jgi:hypothetical protein
MVASQNEHLKKKNYMSRKNSSKQDSIVNVANFKTRVMDIMDTHSLSSWSVIHISFTGFGSGSCYFGLW